MKTGFYVEVDATDHDGKKPDVLIHYDCGYRGKLRKNANPKRCPKCRARITVH